MIGKTEEAILLTMIRIGTTNPAAISVELNRHHPIAAGAVSVILTRMVEKGWVTRSEVQPEHKVGLGRSAPRGFYTITAEGRAALRRSVQVTNQLLDGIDLSETG